MKVLLQVFISIIALSAQIHAQVDPQLGPEAIVFFSSVAEGTRTVCFDVTAIREPDAKRGRYLVDFSISAIQPQENDQHPLEAITATGIDGNIRKHDRPASLLVGVSTITPGKHTFYFSISPRARVRLAMAMRKSEDRDIKIAYVRSCQKK